MPSHVERRPAACHRPFRRALCGGAAIQGHGAAGAGADGNHAGAWLARRVAAQPAAEPCPTAWIVADGLGGGDVSLGAGTRAGCDARTHHGRDDVTRSWRGGGGPRGAADALDRLRAGAWPGRSLCRLAKRQCPARGGAGAEGSAGSPDVRAEAGGFVDGAAAADGLCAALALVCTRGAAAGGWRCADLPARGNGAACDHCRAWRRAIQPGRAAPGAKAGRCGGGFGGSGHALAGGLHSKNPFGQPAAFRRASAGHLGFRRGAHCRNTAGGLGNGSKPRAAGRAGAAGCRHA